MPLTGTRKGPNEGKGDTTMSLRDAMHQKSAQAELPLMSKGEARRGQRSGEALTATRGNDDPGHAALMERIVDAANIQQAYKRVKKNKGSPGMDGMTVDELSEYLGLHWLEVREALLNGTYQPRPVLRREIEKADGGTRMLGIPTVLDRLVQQAILQVVQPGIDATFSPSSYGYRPGRSAHDAVRAARGHIQSGKSWVADVDLSKFFDTVNHDILMAIVAKHIPDRRVQGLIRRYLTAGILADGAVVASHEGTPQGGPLSPLLANMLLDKVDKELERRGLAFCRYADDCNVYVGSERAARDAMQTLREQFARLHLQVNESKSAVGRPWERKFLGYSFWKSSRGIVAPFTSSKAMEKLKANVRLITDRNAGKSLAQVVQQLRTYLRGWRNYFKLDEEKEKFRKLDRWIRRRLRVIELRHWKTGRTTFDRLRARGAAPPIAGCIARDSRRFWHVTRNPAVLTAMPDDFYTNLGVPLLAT